MILVHVTIICRELCCSIIVVRLYIFVARIWYGEDSTYSFWPSGCKASNLEFYLIIYVNYVLCIAVHISMCMFTKFVQQLCVAKLQLTIIK